MVGSDVSQMSSMSGYLKKRNRHGTWQKRFFQTNNKCELPRLSGRARCALRIQVEKAHKEGGLVCFGLIRVRELVSHYGLVG